MGSSGTLHCTPITLSETAKLALDPEPTMYGLRFSFENDPERSNTSAGVCAASEDGVTQKTCFWTDSR